MNRISAAAAKLHNRHLPHRLLDNASRPLN